MLFLKLLFSDNDHLTQEETGAEMADCQEGEHSKVRQAPELPARVLDTLTRF